MSIETLVKQILSKMPNVGKSQSKFFLHIYSLMFYLRGRYNFENMSRYGEKEEGYYRRWYQSSFDYLAFNTHLLEELPQEERIIALDPSYIPKSGKETEGLGTYWSGSAGLSKKGLELLGIASVGLESKTALHLKGIQTILSEEDSSLISFYVRQVKEHSQELKKISNILVVDAYFSVSTFIQPVIGKDCGMTVISKFAKNTVLRYPHIAEPNQKRGRGRPKVYQGKVDKEKLDTRHFNCFYSKDNLRMFEAKVHAKALNCWVKAVVVHTYKKNGKRKVETFFSTDVEMKGEKIIKCYRLRFQIEFLYRDAKQHLGLNHSQVRSKQKINAHFNISLTAVSLAKVIHLKEHKSIQNKPFSLSSFKTLSFNKLFADKIIKQFAKEPNSDINSDNIKYIYQWGAIAA